MDSAVVWAESKCDDHSIFLVFNCFEWKIVLIFLVLHLFVLRSTQNLQLNNFQSFVGSF